MKTFTVPSVLPRVSPTNSSVIPNGCEESLFAWPGNDFMHQSLGYAPVWSAKFAGVPGARVDGGAFAILAGVVGFFSIVIGAVAYFFRGKRGPEKDLDE